MLFATNQMHSSGSLAHHVVVFSDYNGRNVIQSCQSHEFRRRRIWQARTEEKRSCQYSTVALFNIWNCMIVSKKRSTAFPQRIIFRSRKTLWHVSAWAMGYGRNSCHGYGCLILSSFLKSLHLSFCAGVRRENGATVTQARNQLGTPGGAKSFLRGAQIF